MMLHILVYLLAFVMCGAALLVAVLWAVIVVELVQKRRARRRREAEQADRLEKWRW